MAAYASSDSLSMHWGKPKIWRASAHAAASRSQSKEAYKQEASIIISPTIMMHPTRARSAATAFRSVPCWTLEREHHFLFIVHAQSLSARSNTPARIASSWSMFFASALMPAMRRSAGTQARRYLASVCLLRHIVLPLALPGALSKQGAFRILRIQAPPSVIESSVPLGPTSRFSHLIQGTLQLAAGRHSGFVKCEIWTHPYTWRCGRKYFKCWER